MGEQRKVPFCNVEHPINCPQELPIRDIQNGIANIEKSLEEIGLRQEKVLNILFGKNSEGGMITEQKLQKQSIGRLWKFVWFIIGALTAGGTKVVFFP